MREGAVRLGVGVALVLLLTAVLAGAVVTAAAVSGELSDGDACETGGDSVGEVTPSPENVTAFASNVTVCIADGDGDASPADPPSGRG